MAAFYAMYHGAEGLHRIATNVHAATAFLAHCSSKLSLLAQK